MNDWALVKAVRNSAQDCPDLWGIIRRKIAAEIAEGLIRSLDHVTNPCGAETRDKIAEIAAVAEQYERGA